MNQRSVKCEPLYGDTPSQQTFGFFESLKKKFIENNFPLKSPDIICVGTECVGMTAPEINIAITEAKIYCQIN